MRLRRFLIGLTAATLLVLAVLIWLYPSDEDFRAENPFWNGTADLNAALDFVSLEKLADLPAESQGATLLLIPYAQFSETELEALGDFAGGGGTLIVADDYGFGNQVLESLGMDARFSGDVLLDPLFNHRNQRFPHIHHAEPNSVTAGVETLVLNHATALAGVRPDEVLARSSSFSFLDGNGNESRDSDEPAGPLPVVSRHRLGAGDVILVADPSIFINSMAGMGGNDAFARSISATSVSGVLVDQSHLPHSDLHGAKQTLGAARSALGSPVGVLLTVAVLLAAMLGPVWRRRGDGIGQSIE